MPEKLWQCWGTFKESVHRSKILQVFKELSNGNKQAIQTIVNIEDFQNNLYKCIQ